MRLPQHILATFAAAAAVSSAAPTPTKKRVGGDAAGAPSSSDKPFPSESSLLSAPSSSSRNASASRSSSSRSAASSRFRVGVDAGACDAPNGGDGDDDGDGDRSSPFAVVIDGGSTGSRLHVFEFVPRGGGSDNSTTTATTTEASTTIECVRRGSAKAWTPLSSFARTPSQIASGDDVPLNATRIAEHVLPLFEYAAGVVPPEHWAGTPVSYRATAGMRLVDEEEREAVYDALYRGLVAELPASPLSSSEHVDGGGGSGGRGGRFKFASMRRRDVSTLDGDAEGYYGTVAANYLGGIVDADLRVKKAAAGAGAGTAAAAGPSAATATRAEGRGGDDDDAAADAWHDPRRHGPLGALDMGGASAQIVFLPGNAGASGGVGISGGGPSSSVLCEDGPPAARAHDSGGGGRDDDFDAPPTCRNDDADTPGDPDGGFDDRDRVRLDESDFFSASYLAYGVDRFRERLWDALVDHEDDDDEGRRRRREEEDENPRSCPAPTAATANGDNGASPNARAVRNPCAFRGYRHRWRGQDLLGTGDADGCAEWARRLLPRRDGVAPAPAPAEEEKEDEEGGDDDDDGRGECAATDNDGGNNTGATAVNSTNVGVGNAVGGRVGGVPHPPLRGKFYAMSMYFFVLDCLRELSLGGDGGLRRSWPTPSVDELTDALGGLCSRSWHGDLELLRHHAHQYTRPEVLPHRCVESVYLVTLLRDGFGFHPQSRDIRFVHRVDGSEVEWSLGMALSLRAAGGKGEGGKGEGGAEGGVAATAATSATKTTTTTSSGGVVGDGSPPAPSPSPPSPTREREGGRRRGAEDGRTGSAGCGDRLRDGGAADEGGEGEARAVVDDDPRAANRSGAFDGGGAGACAFGGSDGGGGGAAGSRAGRRGRGVVVDWGGEAERDEGGRSC